MAARYLEVRFLFRKEEKGPELFYRFPTKFLFTFGGLFPKMKLLIVEDDADLRETMVSYLSLQHYRCEMAESYGAALSKIEDYDYDCIVLDLGLPGGDGLQLLETLKTDGKEDGVIIISARAQLDDKIRGLALGADDYLTKPFHLSELTARIAAIIRRKQQAGSQKMLFEEISVDTSSRTVQVKEAPMTLTPKEYDLLLYFLSNKGRVLSKSALATHLWGDEMDFAEDFNFLYGQIKNLRRKLVTAGAKDYIHSMYGTGYKFSVA